MTKDQDDYGESSQHTSPGVSENHENSSKTIPHVTKKPTPVVLPVLPILSKQSSNVDTKTREKPREPPPIMPPAPIRTVTAIAPTQHQTSAERQNQTATSQAPQVGGSHDVSQPVTQPNYPSKFEKFKNAAKQDRERIEKERSKKDEKRHKEEKKKSSDHPKVKQKQSQVIIMSKMFSFLSLRPGIPSESTHIIFSGAKSKEGQADARASGEEIFGRPSQND